MAEWLDRGPDWEEEEEEEEACRVAEWLPPWARLGGGRGT